MGIAHRTITTLLYLRFLADPEPEREGGSARFQRGKVTRSLQDQSRVQADGDVVQLGLSRYSCI